MVQRLVGSGILGEVAAGALRVAGTLANRRTEREYLVLVVADQREGVAHLEVHVRAVVGHEVALNPQRGLEPKVVQRQFQVQVLRIAHVLVLET